MRKYNILKYVFVVFVIALVGYAVYYINKQDVEENVEEEVSQTEEEENYTTISTLRVAAISFDTMNPIVSTNQNVQDISKLVYEPMLTVTEDYQVECCLAKEWISLSDTVYVVVLQDGVLWQTGEELTANDVKFTIEQIQEIGSGSVYYSNVEHITNVEILSTYTVKITIDEKTPFFEYNLTFPIMSAQYYTEDSIATSTKNGTAPGTGMYKINNVTSTEVELKINDTWRGLSEGTELSLDTILVKIYSSAGEAYNAFKLGNLDLMTTQSLNYEEYIGTMGYSTAEYAGRQFDYLALNCTSDVLKYEEVRQAINYAIDKSSIVTSVYENKYYTTDFPLSTDNYLYNVEKVSSTYNTNKSEEVLEDAGWELKSGCWQKTVNGSTVRTKINLVVSESNSNRVQVAEIIAEQLEEVGIIVNVVKVSDSQYSKYLENKNYDMILTGKTIGISPDLTSYVSEGNLSNFEDVEIEELLNEIADLSSDASGVEAKYTRIIKLLEEEVPFVSLYFSRNTVIYREDLKGDVSPNFYNIFYNIEDWIRQY